MQIYMEHFKALVSNIQFFNAQWCKLVIGFILHSFIFQHMTILYLFIRKGQSFLYSHPPRWMGPQFSVSKTAKKTIFLINWWTEIPQKVRLTPSFKNEVNSHQQTTCSKLRPSRDCLLCLFEYMWKINEWRSFFNVVFSRHENFVMQSYMEHFKALVSNIQFFNAQWCK